jgi:phenylpropionate dioxygenase-like ring-hydroxylating dioxygenase large terminal subunit
MPAVADMSLIPRCEAFDRENIIHDDSFRDIPYDYSTLLENVLDISHVPYTHHGTQVLDKRNFWYILLFCISHVPYRNHGFQRDFWYILLFLYQSRAI